ncbi:glycoside hydrolase family 76 protein [Paenibacillus sp. MSJ-34]|uniref:glycoside hydrolase family 76 protein n=1 Tax=Paenibacillus sp. MSJ-34 TaxID=2841529 RepID=UPI001C10E496|nr:glycosyl hydrolase [Paenibacillus sp. MSJ-34]
MMLWADRAEKAQLALEQLFWNPRIDMYNIEVPCPNGECNDIFHYWWMAHAADVLTDGLERTGDSRYAERLSALYEGVLRRNGGVWPNALYDDMEWMALAWLRAYQCTGDEKYKQAALILWTDIRTGWNGHMEGGIAWQKTQLDYKNTPANAPAVILAARLHRCFGNDEDLDWAHRIYDWQKTHLVDPATGFVWDGMNRTGDGSVDTDWKYTYCQGVYIGAALELYKTTRNGRYLQDAKRTLHALTDQLTAPKTKLFPNEGVGDGGLFKGILARYATELALEAPEFAAPAELIASNVSVLWTHGRDPERTAFGPDWDRQPPERVSLSAQLSGMKLLEAAARLERRRLLPNE